MKQEVVLITTKGCAACAIAKNLLLRAVSANNYAFKVKILDLSEWLDEDLAKATAELHDFPTLLFFNNGELQMQHNGTFTVSSLEDWCKEFGFD